LNSNLRIGLLTENLQEELQDGLQALEQLVANLIQKQGFQIPKQVAPLITIAYPDCLIPMEKNPTQSWMFYEWILKCSSLG
jgi:hypothetical protein